MEARHWLSERMREADLDPVIDGVGNVIGKTSASGPKLLVGSHSESQCYAGWLDGILGVIYGIETARALRESPECAGMGIDVGAWADEECHFLQFLGSRSFCDSLDEREIDAARNKDDGTPLRDAIRKAGLEGRPRERMLPSRYVGYLEAHIEQGDYLDSTGLKIGLVTSIVGLWQYRVRFFGEQNHAGTTGMATRKDAGVALTRLAHMIDETFPKVSGKRSVWTTGRIDLDPGAPSIVPGEASMLFQFRDEDVAQLEVFERALEELVGKINADGPCRCELEIVDKATPKKMSPGFQDALEPAGEMHGAGKHVRMPSGAAHDAQIMAALIPRA